ncbi:MAG: hypothetical protein Q9163_000258 [Psora crenata]
MSPKIPPQKVREEFEKQRHYYNRSDARKRGAALLQWAKDLVGMERGSPTAEEKVAWIHDAVDSYPSKGETAFAARMREVLLNEARLVRKSTAPTDPLLITAADFEADPRKWTDDFFGTKPDANFNRDSLPLLAAKDGSWEAIFKAFPKLENPVPDLAIGLERKLVPEAFQVVFDQSDVELTGTLYHVFLAIEFKINNRPHPEAENECVRAGSAMNFNAWKWNLYADHGKDVPKGKNGRNWQLSNTVGEGCSKPDIDSATFSIAISPACATLLVNWREEWENGAVYWHASVIDILGISYGCDEATAKFQRYLSNIIDWGVGSRAQKVFQQATSISMRKAGKDLEIPKRAKRQRTT